MTDPDIVVAVVNDWFQDEREWLQGEGVNCED